MNTKNTKSVIIILLLVANIFFIYNIIMFDVRTQNIPSDMINNAAGILNNKGIFLDAGAVPAKKPTNYIYEGEYSDNIFTDIVVNFSGIPEDEIKSGIPLPDTSGTLYKNKKKYTGGGYIFIFADLDYLHVSIMDESNEKSREDYGDVEQETDNEISVLTKTGITGIQKSEIKKAKDIIENFIKKYSSVQDVKSDFDVIGLKNENENGNRIEEVAINQKYDGLRINSNIAYAEIKDGAVTYFYGSWYFGYFDAKYKMPLLDSVNILFKCSEKDSSIITGDKLKKMNHEYNVLPTGSDKFYLIPSWQLEFESGKTLSYSMVTGSKNN
ncbi:MAG: hypothetical protein FWD71_16960 [Oscillospiraceae bacterium]|nr:hypothetical protein [Oscillospiraceae bacterium]